MKNFLIGVAAITINNRIVAAVNYRPHSTDQPIQAMHPTGLPNMDKSEAAEILLEHMSRYRAKSYGELERLIGNVQVHEATGGSGVAYTLEFDVMWDGDAGGNVRVMGSIDDGSFTSALAPLTDDFILSPDGEFVGE